MEGSEQRGHVHVGLVLPYQEGSKHGDGGQEVPDIVVVKEGKQDAVPVVLTGLRRGFLREPAR